MDCAYLPVSVKEKTEFILSSLGQTFLFVLLALPPSKSKQLVLLN